MLQSEVLCLFLLVQSVDGFRLNFEVFIFHLDHGSGRYM